MVAPIIPPSEAWVRSLPRIRDASEATGIPVSTLYTWHAEGWLTDGSCLPDSSGFLHFDLRMLARHRSLVHPREVEDAEDAGRRVDAVVRGLALRRGRYPTATGVPSKRPKRAVRRGERREELADRRATATFFRLQAKKPAKALPIGTAIEPTRRQLTPTEAFAWTIEDPNDRRRFLKENQLAIQTEREFGEFAEVLS